jgi:hypothetical protein
MADDDRKAHDLFLPEKEDDEILTEEDIGLISVVRTAPHQENASKTYTPQELVSSGSLLRLFGGGSYTVTARNRNGQVMKGGRRHFHFRGASFPMDGTGPPTAPTPEPEKQVQQQQPQYQQAPQLDLSPIAAAMQAMAKSNEGSTALLVELIKGQQAFSTEIVKTLASRNDGGGGGKGDLDAFVEGMKMGTTQIENVMNAREQAIETTRAASGNGESIAETLTAVTGAVQAFGAMKGNGSKVKPVTQKLPPKAGE